MKINTLQENLQKAISLSSRFTTSKSQLPILGNILLKTDKTKLSISSTNLEISISTSIGAKIEEEGEISVPAKIIFELVNNLPKKNVEISVDKEQVSIKSESFNSKVLGMNATDFPKIPNNINDQTSLKINGNLFIKALEKAIFATSTDETRPILTGVLLIFKKEGLEVVATDGFRLTKYIIQTENNVNSKVIIPKNVLTEVIRSSEGIGNLLLDISESDKQVLFGIGDTVISSRLIEGDYPDFEKIIPKNSTTSVTLDKDEMLRAVKLASVFARDSANVVKLKIEKDKILVFAESSSGGNQETQVDAKVTGDLIEVAFNYKFLEDFLHSVDGEEIKIDFTGIQTACILTDTSDPNYLHLIMPVRVQN